MKSSSQENRQENNMAGPKKRKGKRKSKHINWADPTPDSIPPLAPKLQHGRLPSAIFAELATYTSVCREGKETRNEQDN